MSTAAKLVAVAGATGKQGGGVVAALRQLAPDLAIRALSRNPDSAGSAKLAAQSNVEVVKADFDDRPSLEAAFQGCDAVFAVTDFWAACGGDAQREKQQGINLVDAAKSAGVRHFVWSSLEDTRPVLSALGRTPLQGDYTVPHFDAKAEVDVYAREQLGDAAVTSIYPSVFNENLLPGGGMDPQKQEDGSFLFFVPVAQLKMAWCSTPDIGGVAAAAIVGGPGKHGGARLGVAGEHASVQEVADTFGKVFGKKFAAATPPADDWAAAVQGFGVPKVAAEDFANMFLFYDTPPGMLGLRPLEQTREMWPQAQSLEAWLLANKSKFEPLLG